MKIGVPIYFEKERPPTAGVPEGVIEKQLFVTDIQRFNRDTILPHPFIDDSPWYLPQPGMQTAWTLASLPLTLASFLLFFLFPSSFPPPFSLPLSLLLLSLPSSFPPPLPLFLPPLSPSPSLPLQLFMLLPSSQIRNTWGSMRQFDTANSNLFTLLLSQDFLSTAETSTTKLP